MSVERGNDKEFTLAVQGWSPGNVPTTETDLVRRRVCRGIESGVSKSGNKFTVEALLRKRPVRQITEWTVVRGGRGNERGTKTERYREDWKSGRYGK